MSILLDIVISVKYKVRENKYFILKHNWLCTCNTFFLLQELHYENEDSGIL